MWKKCHGPSGRQISEKLAVTVARYDGYSFWLLPGEKRRAAGRVGPNDFCGYGVKAGDGADDSNQWAGVAWDGKRFC